MKELETLKLFRGATSVIELDFTGFNFERNSYCQLTVKKKYNDDIIFQHDFNKSIKYYVTFKDEFTVSLDDDKYKYDIMYMLNDERYPQCSISDVIVDEVVNDYVGEFDKNAVQVTEVLAEGVEITQSIKVTTSNVIIVSSNLQERTVTLTKEEQVVLAEDGFDGMSKVVVESIPSEYVIPTLQDKTIEVKPLENKNITADKGFNGLGIVNVIGTIDTETKEVTPTKETQTISRSDDKYIESVTVNAIPENYIEPSGEMEITENGSYDVTDKASVKVETSGADLSEYFTETISAGTSGSNSGWVATIKKLPKYAYSGTDCKYMFYSYKGANLNLSNFDTSKTTDMSFMFSQINLETLDLSNFDTTNVNNMSYMFSNSANLNTINSSSFNTTNVTNMIGMFQGCSALNELDLSNFDVTNASYLSNMFSGCKNLKNITFGNWKSQKTNGMYNMFQGCTALTSLDLRSIDTSLTNNIKEMFSGCTALTTLNMEGLDFSKINSVGSMFNNCTSLTDLVFGINLGKAFTSKSSLTSYKLDLSTCINLTHDSLMSVINGLYDLNLTFDVANGGTIYNHPLILGETNLAKLTEEEIAIATNKGWTVS